MRTAVSGRPLPAAEKVVETVHTSKKGSNGFLTALTPVWAQFLYNDISYPISFAGNHSFN